ncbi:MAG: terminase gpA endonuclease subunit [Bacteroidota bacterium]
MEINEASINIWKRTYQAIHQRMYEVNLTKQMVDEWVEENIVLPDGVSRYTGPFEYDLSPYVREIVNRLYSGDSSRCIAIMKCAQIGLTQGLIIPGLAYIIAEDPAPILFMAGDKSLAKTSIQERFEPILYSSGLDKLIRPSVVKAKNQKTGDTSDYKEYAGGRLTIEGTQNADKMRQISVKIIFADDWEAAPRNDKKEGSLRKLMEGRQTSYGNLAKTFFVSTPTIKQTSNIEPVYLLGDQRKWHWTCPHCEDLIDLRWRVEMPDGSYAGIVYQLDKFKKVIDGSVGYRCQSCGGIIKETQKYDLNLGGRWIPTATPQIKDYVSYHLNALVIPPGFVTWEKLVEEWLEACPPDGQVNKGMLQTFLNIRMGETWEELGEAPKSMQLMQNSRGYLPGIIPDKTCDEDQNGQIMLLTLACDLNGIMNEDLEDVRLDWELVAHASSGATYSVDQGSIGTFKRNREKTQDELKNNTNREMFTFRHGVKNSAWDDFRKLMLQEWKTESGAAMTVDITIVDTGFFTKLAKTFISSFESELIIGVKGKTEGEFRTFAKDTPLITRSRESNELYLLEVNQLKDELSELMKLRMTDNDEQPEGFMNFPQPRDGKYSFDNYFKHYEGERKTEVEKNGEIIGFNWVKKHNNAPNHFWDVRIYNMAAREIYLDIYKRYDGKHKSLSWADFCLLMSD